MTNHKSTKRALISSVVALFLCFTMLLGTTYAWFTDSVASKNNVIKSGNLDVTLEYKKVVNGVISENWETVEGKDDIFNPKAHWEPGYTEVVYLKLKNAGSLALKYQLGVNVTETPGVNVYGDEFLLSNYIYFDVIEGVNADENAYATREDAVADVTNAKKINEGFTKASDMEAESSFVNASSSEGAIIFSIPSCKIRISSHISRKSFDEGVQIKIVCVSLK